MILLCWERVNVLLDADYDEQFTAIASRPSPLIMALNSDGGLWSELVVHLSFPGDVISYK